MKYILLFLASGILLSAQCKKEKLESVPECIVKKIEIIKAQPKWNPPAEVKEYMFEGKKVYLFSSNCCDQYNELYDADCNYICSPSGGFSGGGDGKCSGFFENAGFVKLVWKDDR